MATNDTVIEILRLQETGLTEIQARLKAYSDTVISAQKESKVLQGIISDPAYARAAAMAGDYNRAQEQGLGLMRNRAYAQSVESGSVSRHTTVMTALNRQLEAAQAKQRNQALAADIASGAYAKQAAVMADLNRERAKMEANQQRGLERSQWAKHGTYTDDIDAAKHSMDKLKSGIADGSLPAAIKLGRQMSQLRHEAELVAKYGRGLGGFVARNEGLLRAAEHVGERGSGIVRGMAQRGFSGTVEQNRADIAGRLLDREVASIFKPLKDLETGLKLGAAKQLRSLNESQQNLLMAGGIGVTGLLALRGLSSVATVAHNFKGIMAAQAAAAGVSPLGGAGAVGGFSSAALKSAIPFIGGLVAQQAGYGGLGIGLGGAYGAVSGGLAARAAGTSIGRGMLGGAAMTGGLAAAGAVASTASSHGEDYYLASRGKGHSQIVAGLESLGASVVETGASLFGQGDEYYKHKLAHDNYTSKAEQERHRNVTAAQGGFTDLNTAYDQLQTNFSLVDDSKPQMAAPAGSPSGAPSEETSMLTREMVKLGETVAKLGDVFAQYFTMGRLSSGGLTRPDGS